MFDIKGGAHVWQLRQSWKQKLCSGTSVSPLRWTTGWQEVLHQHCAQLLTLNWDILGWWKKYFEDLLNPIVTPSADEAEAEELGG